MSASNYIYYFEKFMLNANTITIMESREMTNHNCTEFSEFSMNEHRKLKKKESKRQCIVVIFCIHHKHKTKRF